MRFRRLSTRLRRALLGPEPGARRSAERVRAEDQRERQRRDSVALGTLMARQIAGTATSCNEAEFSAFSQFGEDGIIEYLVQRCDISPTTFVEIGVETYAEANTRFLAEHRLWRGLIIDLNPRLVDDLAATRLNWRSQVRAVSAFVTRESIRPTVEPFIGADGLGILSVDIDGVDYWVLERLVDLAPAMVVVEYNSLFGDDAPVSIPYDARFDRRRPEFHNVYYGAGLAAFAHLLGASGYALVACNTAGNNAFFVREDRLGPVPARTVADAYRPRRFVEHKNLEGEPTGITDPRRQLADVKDLPLIDVTDGHQLTVEDLSGDPR